MFKTSSFKAGVAGCLTGLALLLSACQSAPLASDGVTIEMTRDGGITWNEKRVSMEELKTLVAALAAEAPDTPVAVGADSSRSYGDVMEVLSLLQRSGLTATGIIGGT